MSFNVDLSPQSVERFYQQSDTLSQAMRLVFGKRFAFLDSKVLNEFRVLPGYPDPRAWFFAAKRHATFGLAKQGYFKQEVVRPFICPKTFGINERCFICELGETLRPTLDQKAFQAFYPSVAVFMNAMLKDPQSGSWNHVILSVSKSVFQQIDEIWRRYPDRPLMHPEKGFVLTARVVPGTKVFMVEAHLDRQEPQIDEKVLDGLVDLSEAVQRLVEPYSNVMSIFRDELIEAVRRACESLGIEFPPHDVGEGAPSTQSQVQEPTSVGTSAEVTQTSSTSDVNIDGIVSQVRNIVGGGS